MLMDWTLIWQVLSRRRKMLMDMSGGIELEVSEALEKAKRDVNLGLRLIRRVFEIILGKTSTLAWG